MQERLKTLVDMRELGFFFFREPTQYDPEGVKKSFKPGVELWLREVAQEFENLDPWTEENIEAVVRGYAKKVGVGAGKIIHPIRVAVSGLRMGPSLFEMLAILGREKVVARIRRAAEWIENNISKKT